jgi:hypothetical protein
MMSGAGKLNARGDDGSIQIDCSAKLNLQPKLHHAGRKRLAVKDPPSAIGKRRRQRRQQALSFFVAEALDIEGLHLRRLAPRRDTSADRPFIGADLPYRDCSPGTGVM